VDVIVDIRELTIVRVLIVFIARHVQRLVVTQFMEIPPLTVREVLVMPLLLVILRLVTLMMVVPPGNIMITPVRVALVFFLARRVQKLAAMLIMEIPPLTVQEVLVMPLLPILLPPQGLLAPVQTQLLLLKQYQSQ